MKYWKDKVALHPDGSANFGLFPELNHYQLILQTGVVNKILRKSLNSFLLWG
jgi:hypothetical protein